MLEMILVIFCCWRTQRNLELRCERLEKEKNEIFEKYMNNHDTQIFSQINDAYKDHIFELNTKIKSLEGKCVNCMEKPAVKAFVPCGHICLCKKCDIHANNQCFICLKPFEKIIQCYHSGFF